jgi:hypothetical protein
LEHRLCVRKSPGIAVLENPQDSDSGLEPLPSTYRHILTRLRGRRTQPTSQGHPRKPGNRHREPPRQRRPGQAQTPREPRPPHRPRIRLVQHHRAPTHWRCCSAIHSQTCVPSMLGSLRAT